MPGKAITETLETMMAAFDDKTGTRYGRLVVIAYAGNDRWGGSQWSCVCDCGNAVKVSGGNLKRGATRSCGCVRKEILEKRNTKHSMSKTSVYRIWARILSRCTNQNNKDYKHYGGRGIAVAEEFKVFPNFLSYLLEEFGRLPDVNESLDRKDNEGPYAPGNLRYATRKQQASNRRSNILVTYLGETDTLTNTVVRHGVVSYATVRRRLNKLNWELGEALKTPAKAKPLKQPQQEMKA